MKVIKIRRYDRGKQTEELRKLGYEYTSPDPYEHHFVICRNDETPLRLRYHIWFAYQLDKGVWTLEKNARPQRDKYIRIVALGTAAEIEQLIMRRLNRTGTKGRQASNQLLEAMPLVVAQLLAQELELT
jgi:hypothetical protein